MVDVDRWAFRLDIAFVPIGGVFLYDVLRGADYTQPIGLEAGVYGLAVITCAVATAASLLLVRPRLTDWEAPETERRMLRVLVIFASLLRGMRAHTPQPDRETRPFGTGARRHLSFTYVHEAPGSH